MNKDRIRRRAQQGWHLASDHSSPWTETSLLNCHDTVQSPLVSEAYGSYTLPVQQEGYGSNGNENPHITGSVNSTYLSAQDQGVGNYGFSPPPQPEGRQGPQDWSFSMPGQCIGASDGHERSSSMAANIPPIPYEFEGDTCVEDEEDHVEWSLTREATQDTQGFPEQETGTRYLACPFYKHDPRTFSKPKWKSCAHPGYENMHRLKDHLKRRHKPTAGLSMPEETIQESQFEQMRSWGRTTGRGRPAIEQWQHTYRVLFPNNTILPSPYQDEVADFTPGAARQSPMPNSERIMELLSYELQAIIEEDEDLRFLPASSQQRIVLKVKGSVEQLLKNDTEGSLSKNDTGAPPWHTEKPPILEVERSVQQAQGQAHFDLEIHAWNCLNPWINDNQQSVPEDPSSIFAYEVSEIPHIPQHQLGWYGTAVDITDTPEIDAYMYEPRRPHRLKMQQDHGHERSL